MDHSNKKEEKEFTQDENGVFGFLENVHYGNVTKNEMMDFAEEHTKNYDPQRVKNLRESIGELRGRLFWSKQQMNFFHLDIFEEIIKKEYQKKASKKISGTRPKAVPRPIEFYFNRKFREEDIPKLTSEIKETFYKSQTREFVMLIYALKELGWIQYETEKEVWLAFELFFEKTFKSETAKRKHLSNIEQDIKIDLKNGRKNPELEGTMELLKKIKESNYIH